MNDNDDNDKSSSSEVKHELETTGSSPAEMEL